MATCSVADCERAHNQHRQIATVGPTVSFISLLVNSVNDQARTMFLTVQRNSKRLLEKEKEEQGQENDKHPEIGLGQDCGSSLVVQQATNSKASALSCYRKQFIATKRLGGVRRDWMTQEAWAEVRNSFLALPAQERYHYQQLAASLNSKRFFQRRKGADHRMVTAGGITDVQKDEPVTVALRNQPPSFNMLLSAESDIDFTTASISDLTSHLQSRLIKLGSAKELDQYPITEANVLASLLSLRCRGIQMKTAVKHLSRTCQFLAGPKNDEDEFPQKVLYHRNCQGVCCNCYEFIFLKLQTELVDQLHRWARTYKKPSDLVRQDVLLAFDIFLEDDVYSEFYLVTAVSFRGGVQLPVECYTKLEIVRQEEEELWLCLNCSSTTLSRTTWPDPINRGVGFGTIQSISTVELASHLALFDVEIQGQIVPTGCSRLTGARLPKKVVIQEFDYYDVSRTVLRLKGPTEDSKSITVTTAELSRDTGENRGRVKTTKPVDQNKDAKERVDMLSIFDAEPQTSATAKSSKQQKRDRDTDTTIPTADSNPYSAFEDELTREMMEALDLPPDTDTAQSDNGPKWKRDFSGLLDPEQVDDLQNQHQVRGGGFGVLDGTGRRNSQILMFIHR